MGTAGMEVRPSQAESRGCRESRREGSGPGAVGRPEQRKDGRFIESLVQTLIKIQISMKLSLMASLSSQKTNE